MSQEVSEIKRIYHNYKDWEDYQLGMWRKESPENEKRLLDKAIDFTGNHEEYGYWMLQVIEKMPTACEHNLTNMSINRKAWIGHAACCLAFNCPEYITRQAWGMLTDYQREEANKKADYAIMKWEEKHNGSNNDCFMF